MLSIARHFLNVTIMNIFPHTEYTEYHYAEYRYAECHYECVASPYNQLQNVQNNFLVIKTKPLITYYDAEKVL